MGLKYLIFPRERQHMPPLHVIQSRRAKTDCNMKYAGQRGVALLVYVKMTGAANQINQANHELQHKASVLTVKGSKVRLNIKYLTTVFWYFFWKCAIDYNLRDSCNSAVFAILGIFRQATTNVTTPYVS